MAEVPQYRLFNVQLARKSALSPSLIKLVFSGPDISHMKCDAPDQRIKLLLPGPDGTVPALPNEGDWYTRLQAIDKASRPLLRTYTLRHLDPARQELTVEFVRHGTDGPASAFAIAAEPGAGLQIVAPNGDCLQDSGGYEWMPPAGLQQGLIIADETALPAARGILESLARHATPPRIQAFLEVPEEGDCVDLSAFSFASVYWLPRSLTGDSYGEALLRAVKAHVRLPASAGHGGRSAEVTDELLWEKATSDSQAFYGWVAAESTAVKLLRRYLTGERGVDPHCINFMAYWARGRERG